MTGRPTTRIEQLLDGGHHARPDPSRVRQPVKNRRHERVNPINRASNQLDAKFRSHARRAFSLVELMIVMTIVASVAGIAIPRYANSIARYRVEVSAQRVAADLNMAHEQARITSRAILVQIDPDLDELSIPYLTSLDDQTSPYLVRFRQEPYVTSIMAADFGGQTKVTFDGFGRPDNAGTVIVKVGDNQRTIVLDSATGLASVQ